MLRGALYGAIGQCVQLAALLLLARLLGGAEFGVAALVTVVVALLSAGADAGMGVVLVQRPGTDDRRAAALALGASLLLFASASALAAPLRNLLRAPPGFDALLRLGAGMLPFAGLASVLRARLARALDFRRIFLAETATVLLAGALRVAFAWRGMGAAALVLGDLVAAALGALLLLALAPGASRGSPPRLDEGLRIVGTRVVDAAIGQTDRFFIGRFLGAHALGLYAFAWQHAMFGAQRAAPVAEQVALPVLARESPEGRVREYLRLTRWNALLLLPAAALVGGFAPEIVSWLYPARWQEAVPALRALSVAAAAAALNSHPGLLWLAARETRLRLRWSAANLVFFALLLAVAARFGLVAAALAVALRCLLAAAVAQLLTRRVAGVPHCDYLRALLPGAAAGLAVLAAAALL